MKTGRYKHYEYSRHVLKMYNAFEEIGRDRYIIDENVKMEER